MSHHGPVTHHPGDLELTRGEGLKGLTGAQDPAPKGLDPLTAFHRSCLGGRKRDRFEGRKGRGSTSA